MKAQEGEGKLGQNPSATRCKGCVAFSSFFSREDTRLDCDELKVRGQGDLRGEKKMC